MGWSIRKKLIILLMAVTVLPFGSAIAITYYYTTESLKDRFVSSNQDVVENGKEDISAYLKEVSEMTTILYRYTPLMNVFRVGVSSDLRDNQQEINRILVYLYNTRPEIEQMHLYIHKGKDSYTNYHSTPSGRGYYKNIYAHPYYRKLSMSNEFTVIEPTHEIYSYNNLSVIPDTGRKNVISFHHVIRDIPSATPLAFFSIDINFSQLNAIANRLYRKDVEDFYIMNEDDLIVYSSDESLIGKKNQQDWFQKVKHSSGINKSMEWEDDEFSGVIVHDKFSGALEDWYVVKRTPYDFLYQSARETAYINILIGLVTIVIVVIATMAASFKFTAPIKVLIANMKRVEKGELKADFDSLGNDEFGELGRHFKMMIATINDLIQKEYKLEIENKSSQLRVLQSQVNPHFLYNALQSIGTLALQHNAGKVYTLLTSLSKIMRYSMNMQDDIVSFSDELKHVQSYLVLQKQRFDERFEYEIEIENRLEKIMVPKMILQPIVENSFKHGFDQKDGRAFILISASMKENGMVSITVQDNGKGVNEDRLRSILQEVNEGSPKKEIQREAIGLKNITDRLEIYYSNQASVTIESEEDKGFTVSIEIPKVIRREVQLT
ncbi:sensor histidine kinase [Bacillus sp. M6-12]|uniref:sensor histidine kinase n=1 Tax=Bacillus sp. M6-12 TaxID=2054166 RepID=UPI000C75F535|nr:sensor histidine kinase [Bacillus sp. M6-12]PLS14799.1 sensor histidine kinase [Bacillus sp. M6-12]